MSRFRRLVLSAVVCVAVSACDQAPGSSTSLGDPPHVSDFTFSPHEYGAPPDAGDLTVPLTMEVTAADVDGDVETVAFVVQPPTASATPAAEGTLSNISGDRYSGAADVTIPAGAIGSYTVVVYAVDASGALSNQVRGMLRVVGEGEPPVIERVDADPEVVRPPTTLVLVATVSDPDGLDNVAGVEGTTPNGNTFQLFDDGQSFDDEVANDGRYTASFNVDAATPGTQTFTFVATDRYGLESEVFSKDIVVE